MSNKKLLKYFAAKVWMGNEQHGSMEGPYLLSTREYDYKGDFPNGIKAYWGEGPTWMPLHHGSWELVKNYGTRIGSFNDLWMSFVTEFHYPQPSMEPNQGGWLSPDAVYYSCDYGEHEGLAKRLTICLYKSREGEELLEDKQWVKITDDGLVLTYTLKSGKLTQKQINTLGDILAIATDEEFKNNTQRAIHFNE